MSRRESVVPSGGADPRKAYLLKVCHRRKMAHFFNGKMTNFIKGKMPKFSIEICQFLNSFFFEVASHILSLNLTEDRLPNGAAMNAFCNSPDIPLLAICRLDQKGHVEVTNEVSYNILPNYKIRGDSIFNV
jgi:hypothetical protein